MKQPTVAFLTELAMAIREAEHRNVAEHFAAGFLWSLYPEWFDQHSSALCKPSKIEFILEREYDKIGRKPCGDRIRFAAAEDAAAPQKELSAEELKLAYESMHIWARDGIRQHITALTAKLEAAQGKIEGFKVVTDALQKRRDELIAEQELAAWEQLWEQIKEHYVPELG